jgi:hypothetical protein
MAQGAHKAQGAIGRIRNFVNQFTGGGGNGSTSSGTSSASQGGNAPGNIRGMSRDQLRERRIARIEKASNVVEGPHIKVMLRALDLITLLGPFYITVMTTSEVGQLFTHGKPFDMNDQTSVNMYGAALFGELILLGITFFSQYIRSYMYTLEPGTDEREQVEALANGAMFTWYLFAAIGALGQGVYLYNYWHPASNLFNWLLIIGRVTIYTGGDYVCAKYLSWRMPTLRKLMQEEREKSKMYVELEQEDAEHLKREKEADAHIRDIERDVESKDRRADVMGNIEKTISDATVKAVAQVGDILNTALANSLNIVDQQMNANSSHSNHNGQHASQQDTEELTY